MSSDDWEGMLSGAPTQDVIDFGLNPACTGLAGGVPGCSILVRASRPAWMVAASKPGTCGLPLGAADPAAGPAPGRLARFPKMDPSRSPRPPRPPSGAGPDAGGCEGPVGLRPPPKIWPRIEPRLPGHAAWPGAGDGCGCELAGAEPPPRIWPRIGPRPPCPAALASCRGSTKSLILHGLHDAAEDHRSGSPGAIWLVCRG